MFSIILSLILLFIGLKKQIWVGLFLFLCIPFSGAYYTTVTLFGVFLYDFFFLGLFIRFLLESKWIVRNKVNIFPAFLIIVYGIISLPYNVVDGAFLRDFRPAILILEAFLLFNFPSLWSQPKILNFSLFGIVISLLFGLWSIVFIDNEIREASFSYSSLSTYFAVIILLFRDQLKLLILPNLHTKLNLVLILSVLLVLMSWNRTILFAFLVCEILKNVQSIWKFVASIAFLAFGFFVILFLSVTFGIEKIGQSLSMELIMEQLITRNSPSLPYLDDLSFKIVLFGNGFGSLFYIPWFEFWGNDPYFNFLDNTYLTFFIKYGVLGVFAVFLILYNLKSLSSSFVVLIFFFILFFTTSFPYQIASLGVYLGLYLINQLKQSTLILPYSKV